MRNVLICRRTFIAILAIVCLTGLGIARSFDVSMAIASVAIGLAASNAAENSAKSRGQFRREEEK